MRGAKKSYKQGSIKSQIILGVVLAISAASIGFVLWWFRENIQINEVKEEPAVVANVEDKVNDNEQIISSEEESLPKELFDTESIQLALDNWVKEQSGTPSVILSDISGNALASKNEDRVYFAASLYKLYVAYEGYKQLDSGAVNGEELYINGNSRVKCLDIMIRESNSPCAEKLWMELGKQFLNDQLITYGIEDTDMVNLTTTAKDVAKILERIANGEGLSSSSSTSFLDSMKVQEELYRRGLPSGFSDSVTVQNKVGWNELKEWHDASILNLPDGRQLIVVVLTENVGSKNIAKLGTAIELAVTN